MIIKRIITTLIVVLTVGFVLLSGCIDQSQPAPTEVPTASATAVTETPEPPYSTPSEGEIEPTSAIIEATRTPEPTATPGIITDAVSEISQVTGLDRLNILGLSGEDWINLAISALIVLAGYTIGSWLLLYLLRQLVQHTPTNYDAEFLDSIKGVVRALVVVLSANWAVKRLQFVRLNLTILINDIFFVLNLTLIFLILWKLVSFSIDKYKKTKTSEKEIDLEKVDTVATLVLRGGQIVIIAIYAGMILSHFGINIGALLTALGIGGLALSLAAQDTLADMISGFIIMLDQPFRIGDRIEISELGTWGDVVEIGTRTTKIRTRDNRMVIVPNSTIGKNQVVNYTYPDPKYRIQMDIGIGYGMDIGMVRQLIIDTVMKVPGVLEDKPVEALYNEMGESSMVFRVRWWIESYEDTRHIYDRVNTALQNALDEAGIDAPYPTSNVNVRIDTKEEKQLAQNPDE